MKFQSNTRLLTLWNFLPPTGFVVILFVFWKQFGFLASHLFAETLGVALALLAFLLARISKRFLYHPHLLIIAGAFIWSALINILHLLTYPGMGLIPVDELQVSTALRIGSSLLEASALLIAFLQLNRKPNDLFFLTSFGILGALIVLATFGESLPTLHASVLEPSSFKVALEWSIVALLTTAALVLFLRRDKVHATTKIFLGAALAFFLLSQFAFIRHDDFFSLANLIAHGLKMAVYWFIYLALVETTLREPFVQLTAASKVYDTIAEPLLIVDTQGKIYQANRAAGRSLGVSPTMLHGKTDHDLFHNADIDAKDCTVCQGLRAGQELEHVETFRNHGASLINISLRKLDTHGASQQQFVEIIQDLSDLHQARRRLQDSADAMTRQDAHAKTLMTVLRGVTAPHEQTIDHLKSALGTVPYVFRSPHLLRVYLRSDTFEFGQPPAADAAQLTAVWQQPCHSGVFQICYQDGKEPTGNPFDDIERRQFADLSIALEVLSLRLTKAAG